MNRHYLDIIIKGETDRDRRTVIIIIICSREVARDAMEQSYLQMR